MGVTHLNVQCAQAFEEIDTFFSWFDLLESLLG